MKEDNPNKKEELHALLDDWYKSIVRRYKEEAVENEKLVDDRIIEINDPDIFIKYKLIKIRYRLLIEDFGTIEVLFQELKEMKKYFSEENDYYYNYFFGQYKYIKDDDFTESLIFLEKAEELHNKVNKKEPELYYLLALVNSRQYDTLFALHYGKTALEMFIKEMNFLKVVESHIILAINHIRMKDYKVAESYLIHSIKFAEDANDKYLLGRIFHNLGYLHSKIKESNVAIKYYLDSLNYKKDNPQDYTHTLTYLIDEYLIINDIKEAKILTLCGIKMARKYKVEENLMKLKFLYYKIIDGEMRHQKHIEKKIIPYYKQRKNWKEVSNYTAFLAEYFYDKHRYKKAAHYYKMAVDSIKKV